MSLGLTTSDWENLRYDYYSTRSSSSYTSSSTSSDASIYVSEKGNTCTDGKDDGKLGIFSVIGNVVEGAGKSIVNMGKTAITHPLKTAAMIGVCCIPVVGPIVGGIMATKGLVSGVTTVVNAVETYSNATSDAEAKDALENLGGGAVTTGLSAVALKGCAGALKSQLSGGSTTVNAVKDAVKSGKSKGEIAQTAVENGIKETASNVGQVAETVANKVKSAYHKGVQYKDAITGKSGVSLKEQIANDTSSLAEAAGTKVKSAVDKVESKYNQLKNSSSTTCGTDLKTIKDMAEIDGAKYTPTKNGGAKVEFDNGDLVMEYNSKGIPTSQVETTTVDGVTTTTTTKYNSSGNVTSKTTKTVKADGTTTTKVNNYNSNGTSTNSQYTVQDADGNITSANSIKTNTKTGVTTSKNLNVNSDGTGTLIETSSNATNGNVYQTTTTNSVTNGVSKSSQYSTNGYTNMQSTTGLSWLDKFLYKIDSGSVGTVLESQLPGLGSSTNPFLTGLSNIFLSEDQDD